MRKKTDPALVDNLRLRRARTRVISYTSVIIGCLVEAAVGVGIGASAWLCLVPASIAAPYVWALRKEAKLVRAVEEVRSRKPRSWPPAKNECPICGVVDELGYASEDWEMFHGHYAHTTCVQWCWSGWDPSQERRAIS